jgi:putative addiction module component (TIGR02574 family)
MAAMNPPPDKLLRDALALPPAVRAALAGALIESLEGQPDPQAEAEWEAEITRRIRELDQGSVSLVSWSEARRAIHGAA